MKKLILFVTIATSFAGCAGKRVIDRNIGIEVSFAQSWKADLKKDSFTMFYASKPALGIKLSLTDEERNQLVDSWYSLELDQFSGQTTISDNCMIMPKLNTVIRATTAAHSQEITIDAHCEDFSVFSAKKAERLKKFIKLFRAIVFSKPAVRDAPKSDVFYM